MFRKPGRTGATPVTETRTETRPESRPESRDDTRCALLDAAIKLFARKGLDGTTVKELAEKAGVNVSLISYHFFGKEGLYRACLQECGKERLAVTQKLLQPPATPDEFRLRLQLFVQEMLDFCASNMDQVRMIIRVLESDSTVSSSIFEETFLKVFSILVEFFKGAQKAGMISKDVDPVMVAGFLQSTVANMVTTDLVKKRYYNQTITDPKYREKVGEQLLELFLSGVLAHPTSNGRTS